MERKMDVIDDFNGRKIVFIHDIIFKKKQYVEWKDVKEYLKKYAGEVYKVLSAKEEIYIGADFSNEYTGSAYTYSVKGASVKAKEIAVQGILQMIEIATGRNYDTYFAIPVHASDGEVGYYNVFHASPLIRHSEDGKKYLYDIIDIKKETSYPLEP